MAAMAVVDDPVRKVVWNCGHTDETVFLMAWISGMYSGCFGQHSTPGRMRFLTRRHDVFVLEESDIISRVQP